MPKRDITDSAYLTHGLDLQRLAELKAKKPSKSQFQILLNFLNVKKDLPIVAHKIRFDRD